MNGATMDQAIAPVDVLVHLRKLGFLCIFARQQNIDFTPRWLSQMKDGVEG